MKDSDFRERIRYWLDNRMSRGAGSMIRLLAIITVAFIILLAVPVTLMNIQEDGDFGSAVWDSFASTINAWVLYSGDGDTLYIILMALAAVVGLFITSLLIGIISSGIEERLYSLRRGNTQVIESGHIVVLGFNHGAYKLISELCCAGSGAKRCIVVAGSEDKESMEQLIRDNVEFPRRTKVICRSIDTCDPTALLSCAVGSSRVVIINEPEDTRTVKCLLAVSEILCKHPNSNTTVVTSVLDRANLIPAQSAGNGKAIVLHVGDIIARLIAHTCTQVGISQVFTEIFGYSGVELYFRELPALTGKSFGEATMSVQYATPVGILHGERTTLNPPTETKILAGDKLLMFMDAATDCGILPEPIKANADVKGVLEQDTFHDRVLVLGKSSTLKTIIDELDGTDCTITVAPGGATDMDAVDGVTVSCADISDDEQLAEMVTKTDHIIMLSNEALDADTADAETIILLLRVRALREKLGAEYSITAEMRLESNKRLAMQDGAYDFIVATDVAAMIAAQVSETPALVPVFNELLSNEGNELYLIPASSLLHLTGAPIKNSLLRAAALECGYLYLGYCGIHSDGSQQTVINPPLSDEVKLSAMDSLIVMAAEK